MKNLVLKLGPQCRQAELDLTTLDEEARTVEVSFSSELPVKKRSWDGTTYIEILGHKPDEVDLSFLNSGAAPSREGHWGGTQIGVVQKSWIKDKRGRALLRFDDIGRGQEFAHLVQSGQRSSISVFYEPTEANLLKADKVTGVNTYRLRWRPVAIDWVDIPADATIGFGRAEDEQVRDIPVKRGEAMETCALCGHAQESCTCNTGVAGAGARSANPGMGGAPPASAAAAVQVQEIENRAATTERERATGITALGRQWKKEELAERHVREGTPLGKFQTLLLEDLKTGPNPALRPVKETDADLGMNGREMARYSVLRLLRAQLEPQNMSVQREAAFELEVSGAYQKRELAGGHPEFHGTTIPPEVLRMPAPAPLPREGSREMQGRAFTQGQPDQGGYLVDTHLEVGSMIEYLWKRIGVSPFAQKFTGLQGNVLIPSETGEATGGWIAEDGTITETSGDGMFGQLALAKKTYSARVRVTRNLIMQSSIDFEAWIRRHIGRKCGAETERVLIVGLGSGGEPLGIFKTSGVQSQTFNNGPITYPGSVQMWGKIANANADNGSLAYLTNPLVAAQAAIIEKISGVGTPGFVMDPNKTIFGYPVIYTGHVPSNFGAGLNRSGLCFGNMSEVIMGMWGGIDIRLDNVSDPAGATLFRAFLDIDAGLAHKASFCVATDIDHTLTS